MRKQRTASLYSNRHHSKPHCPEDLSCGQCCKCVEMLKKKNKVLLDKNIAFTKEKQDYVKQIMRLNKVIKGWEKRSKQFQNLQEVKRKLRIEVKAQVLDQHRVDDMVLKQKLASIKQQRDSLTKQKSQLMENVQQFSKKFEKATKQYKKLQREYKQLEQQYQSLENKSNSNNQALVEQKRRNSQLESALKDKTEIISQLQKSLSTSQRNYLTEKAKNSEHELALLQSKEQIKKASHSIESLKRQQAEKKVKIEELTAKNGKLGSLVKNLDSTIASYDMLESQLRTRIQVSEDYATQKQIEVKQIESDFYEALYRRSV